MSVVVFGGGIAGLWTLDALRREGVDARLLTNAPLGTGQTIQSQGILHGGGKYLQDPWMLVHSPLLALRSLGLAREASAQPARWQAAMAGGTPDLRAVRLRGAQCLLWLSKRGAGGRLAGLRWLDLAARMGIIAARPRLLGRAGWPDALRDAASAVYEMAEPVVDVGSVTRALAEPHRDRIHLIDPGPESTNLRLDRAGAGWRIESGSLKLDAGSVVLTAGKGNAALLNRAGIAGVKMQVRPLCMFLVRGNLPVLHGHCSTLSPKPLFTVTSVQSADGSTVWQVGGGIAEKHAATPDHATAIRDAAALLNRELPGLDHGRLEWAVYRAERAEPATGAGGIPGSAYAAQPAPGLILGWPVKLVLAPALADRVVELVMQGYNEDAEVPSPGSAAPFPGYATPPWEEASWSRGF